MIDALTRKFHSYINENNPELFLELEEDDSLTVYLRQKVNAALELMSHLEDEPNYIIEEACMEVLTQELKPSKFNYIINILEEEFIDNYEKLQETGTLKFEAINMLAHCVPVFEEQHFSEENEDNGFLRLAITGAIGNYLNGNKREGKVKNELQQSAKAKG